MDSNSNVLDLLDVLYGMVTDAWSVPLGNDKCIIEREKAVALINDIKASLPTSAETKSAELRRVASQYVDDIIRQTVESLNGALTTVQTAQSSFRSLGGQPKPKAPEKAPAQETVLPVTSNIIIEQRRSDE